MMNLWDHQLRTINKTSELLRKGYMRTVVVSPTGSGKTRIATHFTKQIQASGKSTVFLAPRRELIYQTVETFEAYGIRPGMIMAGEPTDHYARVQVASFDTLHARGVRKKKIIMPRAEFVIVDEAHLSMSPGKLAVLSHFEKSRIIGLTATPARADGVGLGEYYDSMVNETSVRELIDAGVLVEPEYYGPTTFDLSGVKSTKSDYIIKQLGEAVDQPKLIGDIYDNWKRIAPDKRTVIFCTTRKHSRHVRDLFLANGVRAEHVDGETLTHERKEIFDRVRSGETQVLCNVFVASYGLDIPPLECCVLARPTKNITLYIQTVGRILRAYPGKTKGIIIDHTGAVKLHGFIDDPIPWSLDSKDIRKDKIQADRERKKPKEIRCKRCKTIFSGQRECPSCGFEMVPATEDIPTHKAELKKISNSKRVYTDAEKIDFHGQLRAIAFEKGFQAGWTFHKYIEKFGHKPPYAQVPHVTPTPEVMGWVKSRQIAYHHRKKGLRLAGKG